MNTRILRTNVFYEQSRGKNLTVYEIVSYLKRENSLVYSDDDDPLVINLLPFLNMIESRLKCMSVPVITAYAIMYINI